MQNDDNNFAYLHVRPGLFSKKHPLATIAVNTIPEIEAAALGGNTLRRYAVGFASQHVKKDTKWNAAMGRNVARGRAERSANNRVFIIANEGISRRDLLILATARVLEATEMGELFASKKTRRALRDTLNRLVSAKHEADFRQYSDLAAE